MLRNLRVKSAHKAIYAALIALPLSACGNGAIDNVKKTQFGDDATLTAGQALDHRKECKSTNWSSEKDDRGRTVVTYECVLRDVDGYVSNRLTTANADLKRRMEPAADPGRAAEFASDEENLAAAQASGDPQNVQAAQHRLDQTKEEYAALDKQQAENKASLQRMIDENTKAVDNNPLTKVDEQFQWAVADDGGVVLTGYSLTASYKSGITRQMHVEMGQVVQAIAQDQQEDVAGYLKAIEVAAPAGM